MKSGIIFLGLLVLVQSIYSCEKKYERPNQYEVDLFENEKGSNKAYIMNREEAKRASAMVLTTNDIQVADSSKGRGADFFMYKINTGKLEKQGMDTIVSYPFLFLSQYKLKIPKDNKSPIYIYLQDLKGYTFIAKERNIHYQWLKGAPVYHVE